MNIIKWEQVKSNKSDHNILVIEYKDTEKKKGRRLFVIEVIKLFIAHNS